jgi:type II secretory pathway component GspD/PulD (secretin)
MKHYVSVFAHHYIALIILLFFATLSLFLPISSSAANETNAGDELISLTVKDEPLGDVLYKVSIATGYDISLDNKWQNYRVTASLEEVSLHKGLKRILRNLNSAIIYVSSKKIKIIIYDKTATNRLKGLRFLKVGLTVLRNTGFPPHRFSKKRVAPKPMKVLSITLSFPARNQKPALPIVKEKKKQNLRALKQNLMKGQIKT